MYTGEKLSQFYCRALALGLDVKSLFEEICSPELAMARLLLHTSATGNEVRLQSTMCEVKLFGEDVSFNEIITRTQAFIRNHLDTDWPELNLRLLVEHHDTEEGGRRCFAYIVEERGEPSRSRLSRITFRLSCIDAKVQNFAEDIERFKKMIG